MSITQREVQEKMDPSSPIQRRIEKGEEGMSRSKAGANEYARWCREVGIQVEISVESTPLGRWGSDASIPMNANVDKFK